MLVLFGERKCPVTFLSGGGNETIIDRMSRRDIQRVLGTDSGHCGKLLIQQKSEEGRGSSSTYWSVVQFLTKPFLNFSD